MYCLAKGYLGAFGNNSAESVSLFSLKRHKRVRQTPLHVLLSSNLGMIMDFVLTRSFSFNVKKFDSRNGRSSLSIAKMLS